MAHNTPRIIIEATQTYSPGNVELLIYLLKKIESNNFDIKLYLGHDATEKIINELNISSLNIYRSSALQTFTRSIQKRKNVLFFCSYPPLGKHYNSIVYYHSSFFFNPIKTLLNRKVSLKTRFSRIFIHFVIRLFNKKVNIFYCQTPEIKRDLLQSFKNIQVQCVPFFNDIELIAAKNHEKDVKFDFFYPATADVHKNYFRLFDAVLLLGKQKKISLAVTVARDKLSFIERINEVNSILGYEAVVNIGRVPKQEVIAYFIKSKAMIFPSLEESLGLPLIEAATLNIPIIGSDLPYIYDVVENPIVFNPYEPQDIADKMKGFLEGKFNDVKQTNKIRNQVEEIINFFKK
jgi:glycosyltransferase involved in cell wall biosynthesis